VRGKKYGGIYRRVVGTWGKPGLWGCEKNLTGDAEGTVRGGEWWESCARVAREKIKGVRGGKRDSKIN